MPFEICGKYWDVSTRNSMIATEGQGIATYVHKKYRSESEYCLREAV